MRSRGIGNRRHCQGLGTLIVCVLVASIGASLSQAKEDGDNPTADRLLMYAGQADIDGNAAGKYALLRDAVRFAPDYKPARWQLGQVQVDGEWMAVEEAQRRAAADPLQSDYRRLRAEHGATPQGQLALARWCRSNSLDEESRFHWASVLSIDPLHREALRALKLRWHDGRLLDRKQIGQLKEETFETRAAGRRWKATVAKWERALNDKADDRRTAVLDEVRAVADVASIPAFERITLDTTEPGKVHENSWNDLSLAFLDALGSMTEPAATESLVRHGVLSLSSRVRGEASDRLRDRPLHDFVPLLLERLVAPIESSFRMQTDEDGSVHYSHSMYREGPFADWSHRASKSIRQQIGPEQLAARLSSNDDPAIIAAVNTRTAALSAAAARRSAQRFEEEAATAEREIARANEQAAGLNERIFAVLTRATEQDLDDQPRAWWDWWQDHTEYYRTADRPVYETQDISNEYVIPSEQKECFARGTPVWTKTGQRPIDSLELGDLVLAQNVESGELAFKPVIGRTVRPPSEILNVSFGGETLRTTRGHPFWVAGTGWRMAKELDEGAVLYGVTGSSRVRRVAATTQEEAYNLVVADFNTYFVGDGGLLVHDNTPRKPTNSKLPGLAVK